MPVEQAKQRRVGHLQQNGVLHGVMFMRVPTGYSDHVPARPFEAIAVNDGMTSSLNHGVDAVSSVAWAIPVRTRVQPHDDAIKGIKPGRAEFERANARRYVGSSKQFW